MESLHLLPPTQFRFRRHHSTETSGIKVYNESTTLSWPLTLASLQLYFYWTSPLLSTVSITSFSSKSSNYMYNLVSLPQLCSGPPHSLSQSPTVLNSVVAHHTIFTVLFDIPQGSIVGTPRFILYTSNIVDIASQHFFVIHLIYITMLQKSWMPRKRNSFGLTDEADWMMTRKQRF